MSRMSSESWKAEPTISPYDVSASSTSRRGPAEPGAVARGGGDQRTGLAGHDLEVVLERVLARGRLHRLQDLALDEAGEGLRLDPDRVGPEIGGQLGGPGEQEVAGEDRDVVVPACVGRDAAAAQLGLVHHVVVVERREVGQLDDARGGDDLGGVGSVTGLGGEQHQQRPEALAARLHQVAGGLGDEPRAAAHMTGEGLLDDLHPDAETLGERRVRDGQRQTGRGGIGAHLMNSPAWAASVSTGPGRIPRITVATTPDEDGARREDRRPRHRTPPRRHRRRRTSAR